MGFADVGQRRFDADGDNLELFECRHQFIEIEPDIDSILSILHLLSPLVELTKVLYCESVLVSFAILGEIVNC